MRRPMTLLAVEYAQQQSKPHPSHDTEEDIPFPPDMPLGVATPPTSPGGAGEEPLEHELLHLSLIVSVLLTVQGCDRLPFVGLSPEEQDRLALFLGTTAQQSGVTDSPHLSFYDSRVVRQHSPRGDGHCLFRAFSYAFTGRENAHKIIRWKIASFLLANFEEYEWLLNPDLCAQAEKRFAGKDGGYGTQVPYDSTSSEITEKEKKVNWLYRVANAKYAIWGDESILVAGANLFKVRLVVETQKKLGERDARLGSHAVQVISPKNTHPSDFLPTVFLALDRGREHYLFIQEVGQRG
ncbi:OTU family cysteine protease [Besnoitia besnoiti]|uniref:OTU family cysteine protease n=1 Tax=Besnoitia besnoiti TaxID=94643 RepID=A0A2A9M1I5_BESBE|nr:OTU family cysteine protease [Besnoitia besnoiti]PFH31104.1 OTU family cysteine protease [Besnoitia besnoiti]